MSKIVCHSCGESIPATSGFCPECGTVPKAPPKATTSSGGSKGSGGGSSSGGGGSGVGSISAPTGHHCMSCHASLSPSAKFCPECGGKPAGASTAAAYKTTAVSASGGDGKAIPGVAASGSTCKSCGKGDFKGDFVTALGGKWHRACWVCGLCRKPITTEKFGVKGDKPICTACQISENKGLSIMTQAGAIECHSCKKGISSAEALSFEGQHYHTGCLKCAMCAKTFDSSQTISMSGDKAFHEACARKMGGILPCTRCGKDITGRYSDLGDKGVFHETCFVCAWCDGDLKKGYTERSGAIVCGACARKGAPSGGGGSSSSRPAPAAAPTSAPKPTPAAAAPAKPATTGAAKYCPECGTSCSGPWCGECGHKM